MKAPGSLKAALAAIAIAIVVVVVLVARGGDGPGGTGGKALAPAFVDPIPYDGRSPAQPAGARERVLVELPRPALGALADAETMSDRAQRSYVRSLKDEARALLSALGARGVKTTDVVTFERTWHGFAATVSAKDLPGLQSLGVRLRANRRFYPATSEPVTLPGADAGARVAQPGAGAPEVALLAGGEALVPLRDLLRGRGVRVRELRVGAERRPAPQAAPEAFARTDELLEALERSVDHDGDGDTGDHDRVALIGVSAPYAGFADAPEALATEGAQRLGTLVVAPSGHEGPGGDAFGTIGSPGGARGTLTVAPLSDPAAVARTTLTLGDLTLRGTAVLGRGLPSGKLHTSEPVEADTPAKLLAKGMAPVDGRLAVVRAGENPSAQAAAAAAAGASAVLLAQPRDGRPLPVMPAGRVHVPVLGVTGAAARAVLDQKAGASASASGLAAPANVGGGTRVSRFASQGPAFDGAPKPELARPGSARIDGRLVSGAGIAAAAVAADAAKLGQEDPQAARQRLLSETDAQRGRGSTADPPPVQVGTPDVRRSGGATGVQFTVGSFERGDAAARAATTIIPAARLDLVLERESGALVERLTPTGGERDVLPGRYGYTLPSGVVKRLTAGSYRFRIRARAPRQGKATVVRSAPFEVR